MPSYLITGTSRGLGLAFTAELLKDKNNTVIATARSPAGSPGLQELKATHADGRLHLVKMDVSNADSIRAAAEQTSKILPGGLDHLVSNAGVAFPGANDFETMDLDLAMEEIGFNVKSVVLLLREFIPLVKKSEAKKILVVSSSLASLELAQYLPGLVNIYSVGKAALNMVVRKWSTTLKNEGITTVLLHPGWSGETTIGSGIKEWVDKYNPDLPNLPVEKSAEDSMKFLNSFTKEDNGLYYNHDGTKLPW